jgi:hypothetical protein
MVGGTTSPHDNGQDRGGRTAAVLYSLTGTCKDHDIAPFTYL